MPGTTTLAAEVTNVSSHCIWLLVDDEELALPYSEFPWFKAATIQQIINVLRPSAKHLYWPDLDIDLSVESSVPWSGVTQEEQPRLSRG